MGDIRIRVGVSLDANVRTVYQPIVAAAQQAAQNVMRALNTGHKMVAADAQKTFAQIPTTVGNPYREAAKVAVQALVSTTKAAKSEIDKQERDRERSFQKIAREAARWRKQDIRDFEQAEQEKTKIAKREADKIESERRRHNERFANHVGHGSINNMSNAMHTGSRIAGDIAHGAGIDFSVGNRVHDFVHREELATALTTEGWIGAWDHPDTAINGSQVKQDPKELMKQANSIAYETGMSGGSTQILEGMQKFLMKTGDLKMARDMMRDMAVFAKATSTGMDDVLDATAAIANQLPKSMSSEEKIAALKSSMMVLGGQGEVGAIHYRQLVQNGGMEKLAGVAGQFTLDESTRATLEGVGLKDKISQNIAVTGAMAQMAMKRGGRKAGMAVNSSKAFIDDLTTAKEQKEWNAAFGTGAVFADAEHTQLKDPKALILMALSKTRGSKDQITKLMTNKNSRAVVSGFAAEYNDAVSAARKSDPKIGKDEANKVGLKAVSDEFDRFLKVSIDGKQLQDKFNEQMGTSASKVAQFNIKLQEVADQTAERLLPALMKLAPQIEKLADSLGKFLVWATSNPGEAIAIAISASIARAAIGASIQHAIETALKSNGGNAVGGALGKLGQGFTILALAVAAAEAGMWALDKAFDASAKKLEKDTMGDMQASNDATYALSRGIHSPEDRQALENHLAEEKKRLADALADPKGSSEAAKFGNDMMRVGGWFNSDLEKDRQDVMRANTEEQNRKVEGLTDSIDKLTRALQQPNTKPMKVEVVNHPKADPGTVNPNAQQ